MELFNYVRRYPHLSLVQPLRQSVDPGEEVIHLHGGDLCYGLPVNLEAEGLLVESRPSADGAGDLVFDISH